MRVNRPHTFPFSNHHVCPSPHPQRGTSYCGLRYHTQHHEAQVKPHYRVKDQSYGPIGNVPTTTFVVVCPRQAVERTACRGQTKTKERTIKTIHEHPPVLKKRTLSTTSHDSRVHLCGAGVAPAHLESYNTCPWETRYRYPLVGASYHFPH